ncbi:Hypothetical protein SRAE_2000159300 [Strongyloides ratti]|uniref:Uncharacterized protein n=1 Tax=Strongyloides ratti TaxID=34506 RepID=A0A090LAZ2_STRRB|nr:Hypothetical protein SRAE_2000159300 [Strongyloides ratti]CEF66927.1 Hypothetical protein SRAE_2000159300 [Strongyloides ratti]
MSVELPSFSNDDDDGNKRNFTPESDSGMNSHPTGEDDDSMKSDIFDQNVVATSTPHRICDDIPQPPNILTNKDIQSKHIQNNLGDFLNTSNDSQKENFESSITDDRSAVENGPLTDVLYKDDPGALTEHLFNTNSFKTSQIVDTTYNLENKIKILEEKYEKFQQEYNAVLLESTSKTHMISFQERKIENLEALKNEQEKLLEEKDIVIRKLKDECEKIPELTTKINNLVSTIKENDFSLELQKDQLLKLQRNNDELSNKIRKEISAEYDKKMKKVEEEKNDLKRKINSAYNDLEDARKKIKDKDNSLEIFIKENNELKEQIRVLREKPSIVDACLQTSITEYGSDSREDITRDTKNPYERSLDMLLDGVRTPVKNFDFSNTVFTTPGIGDQTMLNRISNEAKEMQLATKKLKMVVDFLKGEKIDGVDENVKCTIIKQTTDIIDSELLKQLKKIIQPLQIFETLSKAQKQDLIVMQQDKNELKDVINKCRSSMAIIAKEYKIHCYDDDGEINTSQFWNNLSLFISELKKQIAYTARNETKTTLNGFTPLPKNTKYLNTSKEVFTMVDGGKISPIFSNPRNEMFTKEDKENVLRDLFEKYGEAKEELTRCKENYKKVVDEKNNLTINFEKKTKDYSAKEKEYQNYINELKEMVEKAQDEFVKSETKLKRAKKIIQRLGLSYQNHFNLNHKDMKIDSDAYDCFSVLKHVNEFTKT